MGEKKHKKIKITQKEWDDYQNLKAERENRLLDLTIEQAIKQQGIQCTSVPVNNNIQHTFTFANHKVAYLPKKCDECGKVIWLDDYIIEQTYDRNILHHIPYMIYGWNMSYGTYNYCMECWLENNNI